MNLSYVLLLRFIIYYSIVSPTDAQGKLSFIIRHDQLIGIKNSSIRGLLTKETNEQKLREKRDNTGNVDIKAIQATINDHRTMIEDNRIMIYNMINNSINNTSVQQAISNHYSTAAPMWNSWRDIALIFVTFVAFVQVIYYCACQVKLRPCDYLVSRTLQRHDTRQSQKQRSSVRSSTIDNSINMLHSQKRKYPSPHQQSFVKTVEAEYADIHQNGD
jgi:hypothetical protein